MVKADKDWMMIRMVWVGQCFLVPAHLGSPGQRAVKRSLLSFADSSSKKCFYAVAYQTEGKVTLYDIVSL